MTLDQVSNSQGDQAIGKLDDQVTRHEQYEASRSLLGKVVDLFYDRDADTLASLQQLQNEVHQARMAGESERVQRLEASMSAETQADEKALGIKQTLTQVGTGLLKTAVLFMPSFRMAGTVSLMPVLGYAGTAGIWGLDQAREQEDPTQRWEDFGLGALKGVGMKAVMSEIPLRSQNPLLTGAIYGTSNRLLDSSFNRDTWKGGMWEGVGAVVNQSFNKDALKADVTLFWSALLFRGALNRISSGAMESSPLWNNVATSASFGLAAGTQAELARQDLQGEQRQWGAVLGHGLLQAGVDGLAGVPGGLMAQRISASRPLQFAVHRSALEASGAMRLGDDGGKIAEDGLPKEQPLVEQQDQTSRPAMPVSDWLRSLSKSQSGDHNASDYARAMEGFGQQATGIRMVGGDAITLSLEGGDTLKLTTRTLPEETGNRPFDLPVKERGSQKVDHVTVNYFIQPTGVEATEGQYQQFLKDLSRSGYWLSDPGKRNVVYYPTEDRTALADPWAVERLPDETAVLEKDKPLNAASMSDEEVGRLCSNFADTPFTYKGRRYASFESFYQSLKIEDAHERARVAKLPGKQAKAAGSKYHSSTTTFDGKTFDLGSPAHYEILEDALLQKFLQNPEAAKAFVATMPRPIIHDLGRPEEKGTFLPAADFVRMLTDVRQQLSSMDLDKLGKRQK